MGFDKSFELKMIEFEALSIFESHLFGKQLNAFIQDQKEWNKDLMRRVLWCKIEFARTNEYIVQFADTTQFDPDLIEKRYNHLLNNMTELSSMFVGVKEDFQIM